MLRLIGEFFLPFLRSRRRMQTAEILLTRSCAPVARRTSL